MPLYKDWAPGAAGALDGTETIRVVQAGATKDTTVTAVRGPSGSVPLIRAQYASPIFSAMAWTNMPAAESFLFSTSSAAKATHKLDLTSYTQARLLVQKTAVAGAAASKLLLKYATTYVNSVASLAGNIGTSEVSVPVNVLNALQDSGWVNLAAGAKAEVFIYVTGSGGDGALDPQFGTIVAEFK